ncbi:MAG: alpha/beta hydrolase [Parasphingorhabdus sp.]
MASLNWVRGQKALLQNPLRSAGLALLLLLAGCISPVGYGKIPHSEYVAHPRCSPENDTSTAAANFPYFVVTSRLPDCRSDQVKLMHHRGDMVRYGRFDAPFAAPQSNKAGISSAPLLLNNETQWWKDLAGQMGARDGRVLLYVHGFRETFVTSSRDAVQIARITDFDGPVIQYSWPSQGEFLKYAVDETNMYWDERNFRNFLMKLAQQKWTKEIVLVSHSLGARLVLPAVEYVDRNSSNADSSNISNVILASPDVDRQDFERDIADEILAARRVKNKRRITVYASEKDRALKLSDDIHGYPRLGMPRCFDSFKAAKLKRRGLPERCYATHPKYEDGPELSGLTIVDTTDVSHGGAGHSDYLRSASACQDFASVVSGETNNLQERKPTHLPHVFLLAPYVNGTEPDHRLVCKRDAE